MLSTRIRKIEASGIRKVFDLAAKSQGRFINLSIGQPHFKVPGPLKEAAQKAIASDMNGYVPTAGLPELRDRIARKLRDVNHIRGARSEDVVVTAGVSGGILLALSALLNEGDEVIVPDPYFVLYPEIIKYLGAVPVFLDTYPTLRLEPGQFVEAITDRTKAIIINSPNNPTGQVYSTDELEHIAAVARKTGLWVISDEIYEPFDFDGKFASLASIYPQTITLNGFSKSHFITGWRVGYAHGPSEVIEAMNTLQQYTFVCAPSFAQKALVNAWDVDISQEVAAYKRNRDLVVSELSGKYELVKPEGAFYGYIKIPAQRPDFIQELIDRNILVVPGDVFSQHPGYFRISFAVDESELKRGLEILKRMV